MFCTSCGAPLQDGARFCPKCGAPVPDQGPAGGGGKRAPRQRDPARSRALKKGLILGAVALVLIAAIAVAAPHVIQAIRLSSAYHTAAAAMESGDYAAAIAGFAQLGDYRDSAAQRQQALYLQAGAALDAGDYDDAADRFAALGDYGDSAVQRQQALYLQAGAAYDAGDYDGAAAAFAALGDYEDSADRAQDAAYRHGQSLYDSAQYAAAMDAFSALGDYRDSVMLCQLSTYYYGKERFYDGDYDSARTAFLSLEGSSIDCSDMLAQIEMEFIYSAQVGDIVQFGCYEQDDDLSNGPEPITWRVLTNEDGQWLLLISEYSLECMPYNTTASNITWADSSLRAWLNGAFYNGAFTDYEREQLGATTSGDNVFLLYTNEVERYFNEYYGDRVAAPTAHAQAQGGTWNWWLASNGLNAQSDAAYVNVNGRVETWGDRMDRTDYCVRPSIWVHIW